MSTQSGEGAFPLAKPLETLNVPGIIAAQAADGSGKRLGFTLLGGEVLFEPNAPYDVDEQRLALALMLERSLVAASVRLRAPLESIVGQSVGLLQAVDGRPTALMRHLLSKPEPPLRITKLALQPQDDFDERIQLVADLVTQGATHGEMAGALDVSKRSVGKSYQQIVTAYGLKSRVPRGHTAAALLLSKRVSLPETAYTDWCEAVSERLGPQAITYVSLEGITHNGVELLGGVILFDPDHARPLSPRQQDVALLALVGRTDAEIAKQLGISEETVATHMGVVMSRAGVANRYNLLVGLLREDPPLMRVHRPVEPGILQFSPRQLRVGPFIAMDYTREEICAEAYFAPNELRYALENLPHGLRGRAQFVMALTLGGYLNHLLPQRVRQELAWLHGQGN